MNKLINCFHCDWNGSVIELLNSPNGVKCPKCKKHIPQDEEGWISVNNGLPEEGGFYRVKLNTTNVVLKAPFSFTMSGKGVWVVPDETIITHWKY